MKLKSCQWLTIVKLHHKSLNCVYYPWEESRFPGKKRTRRERERERERESYTKAINLWTQGKQKKVCKSHTCGKNRLEDGSDPKKLHNMEHLFITCGQEHVQHRLCQLACSQCSLHVTTQDFPSRLYPHRYLFFRHGYLFFQNQRFVQQPKIPHQGFFLIGILFFFSPETKIFFPARIGTSRIWALLFAKGFFCPQRRTIHR